MQRKRIVSVVLLVALALIGLLLLSARAVETEVAVPFFNSDGTIGATFMTIRRPSWLLASTLVKIRGSVSPRDAVYHTTQETSGGQRLVHKSAAPDDLHLADCIPPSPMPAKDVFSTLGPESGKKAWGYAYKRFDARDETGCVKTQRNAVPPQSIDTCFLGVGKFIGNEPAYSFVDPAGTLDPPAAVAGDPVDPYRLFIASMDVLQGERYERCSIGNPVCGDWFVDLPEACDDGNTVGGDGCSATCTLEVCGNGIVEGSEQCDDGNTNNTDACTNACRLAVCGDGFVRTGFEQCDDGNASDFDACLTNCTNNVCGDGLPQRDVTVVPTSKPGDPCDDGGICVGGPNNGTSCTTLNAAAVCGPGVSCVPQSNDGCSDVCTTVAPYNCDWQQTLGKDVCTIPSGL